MMEKIAYDLLLSLKNEIQDFLPQATIIITNREPHNLIEILELSKLWKAVESRMGAVA